MQNDINNLDPEDIGLKSIMGSHFVDETARATEKPANIIDAPTARRRAAESAGTCKDAPEKQKPVESLWKPVKPAPDFFDKLRQTAKDVCKYAALSLILFYWQQTGRLEETTAWYSLLVCVGMVFFSVGKNWRGGVK